MRLRTLIVVCVLAMASTACASTASPSSPTSTTTAGSATQAPDVQKTAAHVTGGQSRILAGSSGATLDSTREPLLKVPGVGTLFASCTTPSGRLTTSFVASSRLPSNTNIVVTENPGGLVRGTNTHPSLAAPRGPAGPASQTWQVTPISSGIIEVATIWVTAKPAPAAFGHHGCVAGAQAIVTSQPR